jgi:lipoprotein-anchoring transpeptidase ErfK/SrfK
MRALAIAIVVFTVSGLAATPPKHRPAPMKVSAEAAEAASRAPIEPGATGSRVMRAQTLLDRARFSPGEIDARYGADLGVAVKGYQAAHDLKPTGTIDKEMWALLNEDAKPLMTTYTITETDLKGPFEKIPEDTQEQAKMKSMSYESPAEELGERFHVSPRLLAELNPGKSLTTAGEELTVPDVKRSMARPAARVVVSASARTVSVYDYRKNLLAQYPATIGGEHDPLPVGNWTITVVEQNPHFFWDPVHLWQADPNEAKSVLPPGPNNPVGVVWIGLSKKHTGIHGTPDSGRVRHGESDGCIRLTNWDAEDLSRMVRRGTTAVLED